MYRVISAFTDILDKHVYQVGDQYPHEGAETTEQRIAELSGTQNKLGYALIQAFKDVGEQKPVREAGSAKKAQKSRKKAE